jgi:hypothetical protein
MALSVHQQVTTNTALYGILGRFRKKRKVDQVATIHVGDKLPTDVDIERLVTAADGMTTEPMSEPVSILEVLGPNKALLIGTCCLCGYAVFVSILESHAGGCLM